MAKRLLIFRATDTKLHNGLLPYLFSFNDSTNDWGEPVKKSFSADRYELGGMTTKSRSSCVRVCVCGYANLSNSMDLCAVKSLGYLTWPKKFITITQFN